MHGVFVYKDKEFYLYKGSENYFRLFKDLQLVKDCNRNRYSIYKYVMDRNPNIVFGTISNTALNIATNGKNRLLLLEIMKYLLKYELDTVRYCYKSFENRPSKTNNDLEISFDRFKDFVYNG